MSSTTSSGPSLTTAISVTSTSSDTSPSIVDASRSALLFGVFIAFVIIVALLIAYGFARSRRLRVLRRDEDVALVSKRTKQPRPELFDVWITDGKTDIEAWADVKPMAVSFKRKPHIEDSTTMPQPTPTPAPPQLMQRYELPSMGAMMLSPTREVQQRTQPTPSTSNSQPDTRSLWERFLFLPPQPARPQPVITSTDQGKDEISGLQVALVIAMPTPHPVPQSSKEKEAMAGHSHGDEEAEIHYFDQYALGIAEVIPKGGFHHDVK